MSYKLHIINECLDEYTWQIITKINFWDCVFLYIQFIDLDLKQYWKNYEFSMKTALFGYMIRVSVLCLGLSYILSYVNGWIWKCIQHMNDQIWVSFFSTITKSFYRVFSEIRPYNWNLPKQNWCGHWLLNLMSYFMR